MGDFDNNLPVLENPDSEEDLPSCDPKVYVSNEEGALLAAMRDLRDRSLELRKTLESSSPEDRTKLETELEELRNQWRTLARRREQASIRKIIMLGHLPPDHPIE